MLRISCDLTKMWLDLFSVDVDLQPLPALTFRTIGGILDFYIFSGPSPDAVIQQYTKVIGQPYLPPYWSLGFHLCRYGYTGTQEMHDVIDRNRKAGFPYVSGDERHVVLC